MRGFKRNERRMWWCKGNVSSFNAMMQSCIKCIHIYRNYIFFFFYVFCGQVESNWCQSRTAWHDSMLDVKQWDENLTDREHDTYGLRTMLPAAHFEMRKRIKTTARWRLVSCPHHSGLTSANRYTTCGDSIRKPLATDRLRANCYPRGRRKWEDSVYKDKNAPWNPSSCNILYKDRKLSYISPSRLPLL